MSLFKELLMRKDTSGKTGPQVGIGVKNPFAAGIDIGSKRHYVAVPPHLDKESVRSFGCLTPDLHEMARWLKACKIETIVMESTGVYWIPVMEVLESYGFDVRLVDARKAKNVPGRKTDVKDSQWLMELHTFGLLSAAFRPDDDILPLRSYWRQRARLVESCSQNIQLMQKALEQMNIQLHKVLSDITGVSGLRIIRAIVSGVRDATVLAGMRNEHVKNTKETFVKALTGNYREEHFFALQQALDLYDIFQKKISECDVRIDDYMKKLNAKSHENGSAVVPSSKKSRRKNQPYFDLKSELVRMTGVDLTAIEGIDVMTAMTVVAEQGIDMSRFPSEKHFSSHMGLCPNNRITGGRVVRRGTRHVQSRSAKALRIAAQSLHKSKSALGAFFRRMKARLGPAKAITATAHKLARIIYRMLRYGEEYVSLGMEQYEEQVRTYKLKNLVRNSSQLGFDLVCRATGEVVS